MRRAYAFVSGGVSVRTFLRSLALVYCSAFLSFGIQANGLIGSRGILPAHRYLDELRRTFGTSAFWTAPGLLWFSSSDGAIRAVWILGGIAAFVALFGKWQRTALAVCLVLWLSLCSAGQDFLPFQWDLLLVEAGFLAIFADSSRIMVYLFRWLLFRLIFFSGLVKLMSRDPVWRDLTALHFHYWTQPLPNPVAWLMSQLPMAFQKASTALVLLTELLVPLLFFAPRRLRRVAAWATIALQILILLTGNYAFFNFLTIALALWLFIEPARSAISPPKIALAVLIGAVSGLVSLEQLSLPLPPGAGTLLHFVTPLRIVNPYGLFASMTTSRPEIIVEGSPDGINWRAYEFRYKPGDLNRLPPVVAPHQPRLDWQMWFAALGTWRDNPWFVGFLERLLQGEPAVLRLLRHNPFPGSPPKFIRARVFEYRFTSFGESGWWKREERGVYFPPVGLR